VLVFVDADVVLAPHAVAATAALLEQTGLDLVSPYPRQEAPGATRLVQPLLQWSWLSFLPLRLAERSPRPSLSAANGQLLAVRRDGLRPRGRARRRQARRRRGRRPARARQARRRPRRRRRRHAAGDHAHVRHWDDLVDGYGKSLWTLPAPTLALLAALYVLPPAAALTRLPRGLAGYAAGVAGRVVAARRTGGRTWPDALAHPVSVAAFVALALRSRAARHRGALTWKGRTAWRGPVSRVVVVGAGVGGLAAAARLAPPGTTSCSARRPARSAASSGLVEAHDAGRGVPLRHRARRW
jgi:hypothetical protein